jgi:hypothetical protein
LSEKYNHTKFGMWQTFLLSSNGEVRGASPLAGEASSAEGATSTVVLEGDNGGTT